MLIPVLVPASTDPDYQCNDEADYFFGKLSHKTEDFEQLKCLGSNYPFIALHTA